MKWLVLIQLIKHAELIDRPRWMALVNVDSLFKLKLVD